MLQLLMLRPLIIFAIYKRERMTSYPEIADLDLQVPALYEYVARFQVPVHDVEVMYAVQSEKYLDDELLDFDLAEGHPLLHPHQLAQVPAVAILLLDAYLILLEEAVETADDVRVMPDREHQAHLLQLICQPVRVLGVYLLDDRHIVGSYSESLI
jgi:hypothetical protein